MRRIVLPATSVRLSGEPLLSRLLVSRVCAGFTLPAKDAQGIDLAPVLAAHP
jgi:hypothetical protein